MIDVNHSLSMKNRAFPVFLLLLLLCFSQVSFGDFLANLAKPHQGRSMRATSTGRIPGTPKKTKPTTAISDSFVGISFSQESYKSRWINISLHH